MATREEHRIGGWRFDVAGAALSGPQGERRLEHRAARTLELLCRRRGETVTHAEILAEVWDNRAVSPNSVAVVIGNLRRSLGDDARDPRLITTVAKRGYRLNAENAASPTERRSVWRVAAMAVVLLGALILAALLLRPASRRIQVAIEPVQNATGLRSYDPLARALGELVTNRVSQEAPASIAASNAPATQGQPAVRLAAKLILWNGEPTLSLTATDPATGSVLWSAMAAGPADKLASGTIRALHGFGQRVRAL
jgi:DNA-binding winged helix-turn-helix (wHTH) protein